MARRAVTLMIRYKEAGGKWKRAPAVRGSNRRVKPGQALVKGKVVKVDGAVYELRFYTERQASAL